MKVNKEELRARYEKMTGNDLIGLVLSGNLTEIAQEEAERELDKRKISYESPNDFSFNSKNNGSKEKGPSGKSGFLLLLILVLFFNFIAIPSLSISEYLSMEKEMPHLSSEAYWSSLIRSIYVFSIFFAILSLIGGMLLLFSRKKKVVGISIVILWTVFFIAPISLDIIVPSLIVEGYFSALWSTIDFGQFRNILFSSLGAIVWSGYLIESRRVRNTYTD